MAYLENVSLADLQAALESVEGKTATQRVMVGINYKAGVPVTELARWYDRSRTTIYNWLARAERLDREPAQEAVADAPRPGRPPRLTATQRNGLATVLSDAPRAAGYDTDGWAANLVKSYVSSTFGVEYTEGHAQTFLDEFRYG